VSSGTQVEGIVGLDGGFGKVTGGPLSVGVRGVPTSVMRAFASSGFSDGKPSLVADIDPSSFGSQAVVRAYTAASKTWLLSGTNAATANCALNSRGGITLTTGSTSGDQMVISPLVINSVQMSPMGAINWSPEHQCGFEAVIKTSSDISNQRILAGFKLTSVHQDHDAGETVTDDDYILFVYDTAHSTSPSLWHLACGVGGTDSNQLAQSFVRNSTMRASTRIVLSVTVDNNQVPHFFIDGVEVGVGPVLNTALTLIPVVGIATLESAAKSLTIHSVNCFQNV